MPSLSNSTLSSCPDRDEFQYWSSFYEKPFSSGDRLQIYKGKLNGRGPRGGDFSVVKVFKGQPGTQAKCSVEVKKAQTGADWLARFLAQGQYSEARASVAQLVMAPMDQVSLLNKVLAHKKRRICSGEWILLEEMLHEHGDLARFVDKQGRMYRERASSGSNLGQTFLPSKPKPWKQSRGKGQERCSLDNRELLEAFVHFTHQVSGGRLVICGLEGVEDDLGRITLKAPTIHSQKNAYGETDRGHRGVQEVMKNHVCNKHCRKWIRVARAAQQSMNPVFSSSSSALMSTSAPSLIFTWPDPPPYSSRQQRSPSAPYDPEVVFGLGPNLARTGSHISTSEAVELSLKAEEGTDPGMEDFIHYTTVAPQHCSLQDLRTELMPAKEVIPDEPPPPYRV